MLRKFAFFEKATVNDTKAVEFFKNVETSCCTSGKGHLIFGDNKGIIHVIDRALNVTKFAAYKQRVNHILHTKPNFVVAVGDDGGDAYEDVVKIFNLDKREYTQNGEFDGFQLVRSLRVNLGSKIPVSPVTIMEINQDFSIIALGLGNGIIVVFHGDLSRGKAQMKTLVGLQNGKRITGLGFRRLHPTNHFVLFATTIDSVFTYHLFTKGGSCTVNEPAIKLDDIGCENGCCTMSNEGDLVIGTKAAIWFFKPEGKGGCYAYEGKKILIDWYRTYLIVVSCDFNKNNNMQQIITIYDLKNKFIAYKFASEKMQVAHIIHEWGSLFVLAKERSDSGSLIQVMYQLEEKDTQTKLETLLQKNLYTIAISLVKSQSLDYSYLVEIFRKYGDHLYQKKDYEGAMKQYLRTIGRLEPSYVIRRFLDAQRINNLTDYLEELHNKNLASSEHTTLLLNCYTKLKEGKKEKLDKFIKTHSKYDVQTAIHVCRKAKYYKYALLLAEKHQDHNAYIKIHLEDFPNSNTDYHFKKALRLIESLPFTDAEKFLREYGKVLVAKLPKQTTNVLIRLCADYVPISEKETSRQLFPDLKKLRQTSTKKSSDNTQTGGGLTDLFSFKLGKSAEHHEPVPSAVQQMPEVYEIVRSNPVHFIQAFSTNPLWLMVFLENIIFRCQKLEQPKIIYNTLIEMYLQALTFGDPNEKIAQLQNIYTLTPVMDLIEKNVQVPKTTNSKNATTTTVSTINSKGDHLSNSQQDDSDEDSVEELPPDNYDFYFPEPGYQKNDFSARLLYILESGSEANLYDPEHVLVLLQTHEFKEGILKMYEKLGLYYDILQYHMEKGSKDSDIIEACQKHGEYDPNFWIEVLSYFAKKDDGEHEEELTKILGKIEKDNLVPPLLVVQILAKYKKTKLGTIKDYLTRKFQQDQLLIQEDIDKIKQYQGETNAMRKEVFKLQTSAKIFQLTTCSLCNQQLDLPAVHYMCGHSYHHRCLVEQDECPKCMKQNREILQRKKKFEESSDQHDSFFKQLKNKKIDGFSVVSEYFGRGIFKSLDPTQIDFPLDDLENDDFGTENS